MVLRFLGTIPNGGGNWKQQGERTAFGEYDTDRHASGLIGDAANYPVLQEGDEVILDTKAVPSVGNFVVVETQDGLVCGRFTGGGVLRPENPAHKEIELARAEMIGVIRAAKREFLD
ncbi:MAG TPA: S24 family peptidase [Fimbriimonadaceae bacterium]|nr:S24 family peptidase [Fimbriimonadaceae bacterium]